MCCFYEYAEGSGFIFLRQLAGCEQVDRAVHVTVYTCIIHINITHTLDIVCLFICKLRELLIIINTSLKKLLPYVFRLNATQILLSCQHAGQSCCPQSKIQL